MAGRTALVVGATGLVGGFVLDRLLEREDCARVVVFARRAIERSHAKLSSRIVDFERLAGSDEEAAAEIGDSLEGVDDVYACLGTTIKVAGTRERFRRIDHEYTVAAARWARHAGAQRLGLVSSVGASERSASAYTRVKGETERTVRELGFEVLVVVRPSLLLGDRTEHRAGEKVATLLTPLVSWALVGGLDKYRPIDARAVGRALVEGVVEGVPGERLLEHRAILGLSERT